MRYRDRSIRDMHHLNIGVKGSRARHVKIENSPQFVVSFMAVLMRPIAMHARRIRRVVHRNAMLTSLKMA